jgi:hypothetical protein
MVMIERSLTQPSPEERALKARSLSPLFLRRFRRGWLFNYFHYEIYLEWFTWVWVGKHPGKVVFGGAG